MLERDALNHPVAWDGLRKLFFSDPRDVALDSLEASHEGRLVFEIGSARFETCFVKRDSPELMVFLSGPGRIDLTKPVFWRKSYSAYFDASCLYIDDPCNVQKKYAPTFFWGTGQENYLAHALDIVHAFQHVHGIPDDHVTFLGCSNTGFAALWCAARTPRSRCIAISPQVDIRRYLKDTGRTERFRKMFGYDFEKDPEKRTDITDLLAACRASRFFITSNIGCRFDLHQIDYLCQKLGRDYVQGLNDFGNFFLYVSTFDVQKPHHFVPMEAYCVAMYEFLKKGGPATADDHYRFNALNRSLYWYIRMEDENRDLRTRIARAKKMPEFGFASDAARLAREKSFWKRLLLPFSLLRLLRRHGL